MRQTARLLGTYIPAFSPTGLTGLLSHPTPRPALVAIYNSTLSLLQRLPEHSVYRTSTTTLTNNRLASVNSVLPENYDSYASHKLNPVVEHLKTTTLKGWTPTQVAAAVAAAQVKAAFRSVRARVPDNAEGVDLEGLSYVDQALKEQEQSISAGSYANTASEASIDASEEASTLAEVDLPGVPAEPALTAEQIVELEGKIGAGLLEEVIAQGVAELKLVQEMLAAKPWEDLIEQPVEGQWIYFERSKPPGEKLV
ncbi:hypothetical protein DFH27DRAFT_542819 [Peziza echinospora]|nr:hypothetical protein DFH27DRAFT_542819 [Peziza echinospora]